MYFDRAGHHCLIEDSCNLHYVLNVMECYGLSDAFSVVCNGGERCIGLSREEVLERTRNSALLVNIMGFFTDEEILSCAPRRVFLDIDPGFGQIWRALGPGRAFSRHHDYATLGPN